MDPEFVQTLRNNHVAAWNERDRARREALLQTIYSENIKMYDPNTVIEGLQEVSSFIEKLHSQDSEFYFSEAKPIDFSQNGIRLYGHIGTKQNPNILNSMDFFIIENGKAAHLYVFMEPAG